MLHIWSPMSNGNRNVFVHGRVLTIDTAATHPELPDAFGVAHSAGWKRRSNRPSVSSATRLRNPRPESCGSDWRIKRLSPTRNHDEFDFIALCYVLMEQSLGEAFLPTLLPSCQELANAPEHLLEKFDICTRSCRKLRAKCVLTFMASQHDRRFQC